MRVRGVVPSAVCGVLAATVVFAGSGPVTVSPGDASELVSVRDICPTFSWGGVDGASSYELIIYRLGIEGQVAKRVYTRRIPAAALAWTPSLDRCLEWGGRYAWSVRAHMVDGPTAWAEPSLFRVPPTSVVGRSETVPGVNRETSGSGRMNSRPERTAPPMPGSRLISSSSRDADPPAEEEAAESIRYGIRAVLAETSGQSIAIEGSTASSEPHSVGVAGHSDTSAFEVTYGVTGSCNAANVSCTGVYGANASGHGVYGRGWVGILGLSESATGSGGVFLNFAGGDAIIAGQDSMNPDFTVDSDGNVTATSFTGVGSGLVDLPLTIIRRSEVSIGSTPSLQSPSCAAGELLTGGGCYCDGAELRASQPWPATGSPERWNCRCSSAVTVTAEAICLQVP